MTAWHISADDPLAIAAVAAVQAGDATTLERLLRNHPGLAAARLGTPEKSRTLLHAATDWPGHFPNGPATVAALLAVGADVNARMVGPPPRPRCTGPPAATTSSSWTPCWTPGPTSRRLGGHRRRHAPGRRGRLRAVAGGPSAGRARGGSQPVAGRRAGAAGPRRGVLHGGGAARLGRGEQRFLVRLPRRAAGDGGVSLGAGGGAEPGRPRQPHPAGRGPAERGRGRGRLAARAGCPGRWRHGMSRPGERRQTPP